MQNNVANLNLLRQNFQQNPNQPAQPIAPLPARPAAPLQIGWQDAAIPGTLSYAITRSGLLPKLIDKSLTSNQFRRNPNIRLDADQNTLLILAANKNDANLVTALLKIGANKNIRNRFGLPAYQYAKFNRNQALMKILQPDEFQDELQKSNLIPLLRSRQIGLAQIKRNPNLRLSPDGLTLLMVATNKQNENLVRQLLKLGANKNIRTNIGIRAVDFAKTKRNQRLINLLK